MANAKKTAEEFMIAVKTEEDFIKMAYEYASEDDKETYEDDDATLYNVQKGSMNTYYLDWLLEENREEGDIDIFEGSNAYYITYFIKRDSNDYETVNIRTIFIGIDSVNKDDYELNAEYEEAVEDEIEEAEEQAEDILNEFVGGIADSETFANLSDKYDEQYTREDGGLVENVSHNQYAEIINTWLFDKDRKSEDVEMFFIEDEGYYIIFFEEKAERYCDYLADNELRNEEYDAWREEIEADVTYDTKFWFKFVA